MPFESSAFMKGIKYSNEKKFGKFVLLYWKTRSYKKCPFKFLNIINSSVSELLRLYERLHSYADQIDTQLQFYQDLSRSTFILLDPNIEQKLNATKTELQVNQLFNYGRIHCVGNWGFFYEYLYYIWATGIVDLFIYSKAIFKQKFFCPVTFVFLDFSWLQ